MARHTDGPAAFDAYASVRQHVRLLSAVQNYLLPCQKMSWAVLYLPSRRVPVIYVWVSDGGRVLVGGRFSLTCRRKVSSSPRCWREVHFGPWCFDFVFITDLLKLKFYCFQLCHSIKIDYIRSFYFNPYTFDFYSFNFSGTDVLISLIWSSNWNW